MTMRTRWPATIPDIPALDDLLSEPSDAAIGAMRALAGDVLVLGAGGKMGPSLARMIRRASDLAGRTRRVIAVSRFSDGNVEANLHAAGVDTIRCDLLDAAAVETLPEAPHIIFMVGRKFGSTGLESLTWAMNCYVPAIVCRRFARSRIVAFSTGNVYGPTPLTDGGSKETDQTRPVGEYAMSCLGRERIIEHFSRANGTPAAILRLNYAVEMRYGVLVDLASRVLAGLPIDVVVGACNVIWQADANAMAIAALPRAESPPLVVNVAGPEQLSVRDTALELGRLLSRSVTLSGTEADDALLSNGSLGWTFFGRPRVPAARLIAWTADWLARGGTTFGKPTHFQSRDGRF
jgi:nucleoside-diphosphate-sugar epimerase